MACRERPQRDRVGPPIRRLGIVEFTGTLACDAEVVQGVGEVRMVRAESRLLQGGGVAETLLCRGIVALLRRLLRGGEDRCSVTQV
jgi:hypothetical protein